MKIPSFSGRTTWEPLYDVYPYPQRKTAVLEVMVMFKR